MQVGPSKLGLEEAEQHIERIFARLDRVELRLETLSGETVQD
ncbi:hypothetical protein [Thermogemmatispora carboxidivorans]|nr:hypothetical protein [Thermogemmatispora carboxidivorans]